MLALPRWRVVLVALTSKLSFGRLYGVIGTLAIVLSFVRCGRLPRLERRQEERQVVAVD